MNSKILSKGALSVRLPVSLNIIGKNYHLETSLISNEYLMLKIFEDDFEYIPELGSNIFLFINLNLSENGIIELKGKLLFIENFSGGKKGIWIKYETNTESELKKITEYINALYIPRYIESINVEVLSEKEFFQAKALNISENGIFIETKLFQLEERDICILSLFIKDETIQMKSEVSWISNGEISDKPIGYGFKFIHNGPSRYKINQYLKTLKLTTEILR